MQSSFEAQVCVHRFRSQAPEAQSASVAQEAPSDEPVRPADEQASALAATVQSVAIASEKKCSRHLGIWEESRPRPSRDPRPRIRNVCAVSPRRAAILSSKESMPGRGVIRSSSPAGLLLPSPKWKPHSLTDTPNAPRWH